MISRFDSWKNTLSKYFRNSIKGEIISPWHHYKLKNLEKEMK
jgi:hypothetical protein